MRKVLIRRPPKARAATATVASAGPKIAAGTLEFELKRKIYSQAAAKAAADGVICGYEEPTVLRDARRQVLQEAVVKAETFEELKAVVTMMLDSDDGLVEGLADIQKQLASRE